MTTSRAITASLLLAATGIVTGCGATKIDSKKAEKQVTKLVQTQIGSRVKSVSCPSGKTAKKGDSFSCAVVGADGTKGNALVTEKDDTGHVLVTVPFIHTGPDGVAIAKDIEAKRPGASNIVLRCPDIVPGRKGTTFDCKATDGKGTGIVTVTISADDGSFHYKLRNGAGG